MMSLRATEGSEAISSSSWEIASGSALAMTNQCVSVTFVILRGFSVSYPFTVVRWQANN